MRHQKDRHMLLLLSNANTERASETGNLGQIRALQL